MAVFFPFTPFAQRTVRLRNALSSRKTHAAASALVLGTLLLAGCQSLEMSPDNVAHVRVIAASPDIPAMDFYAGGEALAYGVEFGSASSYVPLLAGHVKLSANTASSAQALVKQKTNVVAGRQYTAIVTNVAANLQENIYPDQTQPAAPGQMELRVIDAATRAGSLDLYLVASDGKLPGTLPVRVGLTFGASTGYMEQPAGTYSLVVVATGTVPVGSRPTLMTGPQVTYASGAVRTVVLVDKPSPAEQPGIVEIVADDYSPS